MNAKTRSMVLELLGTLILVFMSAGAILTDSYTHGAVGLLGIALAYGMTFTAMIWIFGDSSGGYFNPAITLGAWIAGTMEGSVALSTIVAQLIGGSLGALLLRGLFPMMASQAVHLGTPALSVGISPLTGVFLEAILTFILMMSVLKTGTEGTTTKSHGFTIGMILAVSTLVAGPLTGSALNPARAFGPALVSGSWDHQWIYWLGPMAGAALAAWAYPRWLSKTS